MNDIINIINKKIEENCVKILKDIEEFSKGDETLKEIREISLIGIQK